MSLTIEQANAQLTDKPGLFNFEEIEIRGVPTREWTMHVVEDGLPVLPDKVICEFKYRTFLPVLFKEVIQAMRLTPCSVSKYRALLRAWGQAEDGRAVDG